MKEPLIADLTAGLAKRDRRALAQAITIVENGSPGRETLLDYVFRTAREDCLIAGVTGAGGAGKSTLIDGLLQEYAAKGLQVGVLAVDPSSAYSGGAVLGDRVRMGRHALNQDIFIRSFASRGALGGISQAAKDVLYLYKSFGFDVILLESYGVGQAETDITNFVDVTAVVMSPGNGDYIQFSKAGTQEIADIFVVNKADQPEAGALCAQLSAAFLPLPPEQRPLVVKTVARDHVGVQELAELLLSVGQRLLPNRATKKRIRICNEILTGALTCFHPTLQREVEALTDQVLEGKLTPFSAAEALGSRLTLKDSFL